MAELSHEASSVDRSRVHPAGGDEHWGAMETEGVAVRLSRFRCLSCRYGASCRIAPHRCPMCGGKAWEYEDKQWSVDLEEPLRRASMPYTPSRLEVAMPSKSSNVKNEKQYEALKDKGMSKERAARISNSSGSSGRGGKSSGSGSSRSSSSQGGTTAQKKAAGRKGGKATARKSS